MPSAVRRIYEEAMPALVAEEQLRAIEAVLVPHMDEKAARRVQQGYLDELPKSDAPPEGPREDVLTKFGIDFVDERVKTDA